MKQEQDTIARSGSPLVGLATGLMLWTATLAGFALMPMSPSAEGSVILLLMMNVTFLSIGIGIETARRPFSLHVMHLVSVFLFLGAPALFQYTRGQFAIAGPIAGVRPYIGPAALAVMLWILTYTVVYELHHRIARSARGWDYRYLSREVTKRKSVFILALSVAVLVYLAVVVGLSGVGTRSGTEERLAEFTAETAGGSGFYMVVKLVNGLVLRALPLIAVGCGFLMIQRKGIRGHGVVLLAVLLVGSIVLIASNPFAGSRTWLVVSIFGVLGSFIFLRWKSGWVVVAAIVGGLAFLPALSDNRYALSFDEWLSWFRLVSPLEYLAISSDTDSLGMTILIYEWTVEHGCRWGQQLLAGLFFFVPRRFWESKAVGTGRMVTEDLGFEFNNLSPPILAEGLIDFGFAGVAALAALVALLFSRLDGIFWMERKARGAAIRVVDVIYPFWIGLTLLLIRGDILAAVAHIAAFTLWIFILGVGGRIPVGIKEGWASGVRGEEDQTESLGRFDAALGRDGM